MERFESIVEYVSSEDRCRSQIIENYFGDKASKECGVCDVCLRKRRGEESQAPVVERIMALLRESELDIKELTSAMNVVPERVVDIVDKMVADKKISISKYGKLKING
jgi:ATP-dependent DNA helicase RecQ